MKNNKNTPISKINNKSLKDINKYIGTIYCVKDSKVKLLPCKMTFSKKGFALENIIEAIRMLSEIGTQEPGHQNTRTFEVIETLAETCKNFLFNEEAEFLDDLLNVEAKEQIVEINKL